MKKFLLTIATVAMAATLMTACGGAEEDPVTEDPMIEEETGIEDPATGTEGTEGTEEVPMDEPIEGEESAEMGEGEELLDDVDIEGEETGDELAEEPAAEDE